MSIKYKNSIGSRLLNITKSPDSPNTIIKNNGTTNSPNPSFHILNQTGPRSLQFFLGNRSHVPRQNDFFLQQIARRRTIQLFSHVSSQSSSMTCIQERPVFFLPIQVLSKVSPEQRRMTMHGMLYLAFSDMQRGLCGRRL
jgi:hypothetical protein